MPDRPPPDRRYVPVFNQLGDPRALVDEVATATLVTVAEDAEWLLCVVTALTDRHEAAQDRPWAVADAPAAYVAKQLRAIVGLELEVRSVEAKAKLSQNRSEEDRAGVVAGLGPEHLVGRAMR